MPKYGFPKSSYIYKGLPLLEVICWARIFGTFAKIVKSEGCISGPVFSPRGISRTLWGANLLMELSCSDN